MAEIVSLFYPDLFIQTFHFMKMIVKKLILLKNSSNVFIHKDSKIGKNCVIGSFVKIGPGVKIGDNCIIGDNVNIYFFLKLQIMLKFIMVLKLEVKDLDL